MRLNPDLPAELEHIINKALEKDRNLRYQHASDMRTDLQRLKRDSETGRVGAAKSGTVAVAQDSGSHVVTGQPVPASGSVPAGVPSSSSVVEVSAVGRKLWKILVRTAGVAAVVALIGGGIYFRSRSAMPLTEKDTIVLTDFTNTSGDAVFDDALKQALAVNLGQSPFLNVLSERKVSETLRLMGGSPGEHVTPEIGRELCLRTGSKAILAGSISSLGSHYVIGLEAVSCGSGDTLAKEQADAPTKESVLQALDKAASSLRTKLGESIASVQKFDVPVEATTPSLEALKNLQHGHQDYAGKGGPGSGALFQTGHRTRSELCPGLRFSRNLLFQSGASQSGG